MTRLVGIDQSLASTGIAIYDDGEWVTDTNESKVSVYVHPTKPTKGCSKDPIDIHRRLDEVVAEVWQVCDTADGVAIEGPSYGSTFNVVTLGGLFYRILGTLMDRLTPIILSPGQLKKLATGKGNSNKSQMGIDAFKRLGFESGDENKVDARWLLEAQLQLHGLSDVELPQSHLVALEDFRR